MNRDQKFQKFGLELRNRVHFPFKYSGKGKEVWFMFISIWPCMDSHDVGGSPRSYLLVHEKVVA